MNQFLQFGRYLFPLSFLLYVGLHAALPQVGADMLPGWLPFPLFWNYLTGALIAAFIVSALIGKYDKLATVLMIVYVAIVTVLIHVPRAAEVENDMINIFRNVMVIGALMVYARYVAKDSRVVG